MSLARTGMPRTFRWWEAAATSSVHRLHDLARITSDPCHLCSGVQGRQTAEPIFSPIRA